MPQTALKKTKNQAFPNRSFEEFLLEQKFLTKKQLADVRLWQASRKRSFDEALIENKIFDEEKLTRAKATFFHLPYVDLRNQTVPKDALAALSKESLDNYQFLPFAKEQNVLKVALTNPTDLQALEALEFLARKNNYQVELYLASLSSYKEALSKGRSISSEVSEALEVIETREKKQEKEKEKPEAPAEQQTITSAAPIAKIVDVIIQHAIEARASDIHIEPQEHDLRIRYRIDGVLQSSLIIPRVVHPAIVSRIKILSNLKIDEQRLPQDGRFHMNVDTHSIDFRVSTLPTVNGEKLVMRILDKSGGVPTLAELGMDGNKLERVKENIEKAHGMFLVTGPTGSGKSTTLYSVLNILNKVGVNIVTLEDPVEYFIEGVNQSQVNPDIGLTFASGLRSILRQDPDIIMVGEIRDRETAELAVHSALTGHLVFSTLHTNSAIGAIPRLVDMGIEEFLLTASLNLTMAQRLVRRICEDCKKSVKPSKEIQEVIRKELVSVPEEEKEGLNMDNMVIYIGEGCTVCGDSGYRGRVGIFEVLPLSTKMKDQILNHESTTALLKTALAEGMINMKQDGMLKVLKGVTTIEEVIRVTKE